MKTIRLRPQFVVILNVSPSQAIMRLQAQANASDQFAGQFRDHHAMITVCETDRHFWSPWLSIDTRAEGDQPLLVGRFSPNPSIWTGFIFAYLTLIIAAFFSFVFAGSQVILGHTLWGLLGLPICGLIAILLWLTSQIGQRLASEQMLKMQTFVESSIEP